MSLTFPSELSASCKDKSVELYFVYQFYYDDETAHVDYIALTNYKDADYYFESYSGHIEGDLHLYGVVVDPGEIVHAIDLSKSKASVGAITVTCVNQFKNTSLAAELYYGTRKYINHKVKIFLCSKESLEDSGGPEGALIGIYRFVDIRINQETCELILEEWTPFDFIQVPNIKTSVKGVYVPVVYGNYTAVNDAATFATGGSYHPLPVLDIKNNHIYCLTHQNETTQTRLHVYEKTWDIFAPLAADNGNAEEYESGIYVLLADHDLDRSFKARFPTPHLATSEWDDSGNAIDNEGDGTPTTYAYEFHTITIEGDSPDLQYTDTDLILDCPGVSFGIIDSLIFGVNVWSQVLVEVVGSGYAVGSTNLYDVSLGTDEYFDLDQEGAGTNTLTQVAITATKTDNYADILPNTVIIRGRTTNNYSGANPTDEATVEGTFKVYDAWAVVSSILDFTNEPDASYNAIHGLTKLFSAADGFAQSYTDGSGLADEIHEIHRDIMYRYGGVDYDNDYMANWSDLNTARTGWNARLWFLEPTDIKEVLEQLQFEGCFIFMFTHDGAQDGTNTSGGRYIWIKNSYSSGDVKHTLTEDDYAGLVLGITPFSDMITQTTYNYRRHAADDHYIKAATITNSTARTNWNIGTYENKTTKNLDFLVSCGDNTENVYDTGSADGDNAPNESIACYYDNIQANPRIIAECTIINPAKINLEVGDIVQFNDSNILPFGESWATLYFMIIETRRTPNMLSITCKEVYNS